MIFSLDHNLLSYAINNPFSGCKNPERAAIGRVAEPLIINHICENLNIEIANFDDERLPIEFQSVLSTNKKHDGLIFLDNTFMGVNETKVVIYSDFIIPFGEIDVANFCKDAGLIYLLSIAKANIKNPIFETTCEYLGCVDFNNMRQINPKILQPTGIGYRIFISEILEYLEK